MKKIICSLLCLAMVFSVFAVLPFGVSANSWTIRTEYPSSSSSAWKYYSSPLNTFPLSAYNGGNCTWYAFGRAYEVFGRDPGLRGAGDAGNWYSYAINNGFSVGSTPKAGSIICWSTHVGFVEDVSGNTVIWTESNYQYNKNESVRNFRKYSSIHPETYCSAYGGCLLGYIYLSETGGPHTHSYNTYVYYWASHPHYKCYKCSCGEVKEDRSKPTYVESCLECQLPSKPSFKTLNDTYLSDEYITFEWVSTSNTTHYNIWLDKKNSLGEWKKHEHITFVTSGTTKQLPVGEYRCHLQSYNSNYWFEDNSDWLYTLSDYCYFSVNPLILKGDLDDNDHLDSTDALTILHAVVGKVQFTDTQNTAGDVDGDGKITATDALLILHFIVGKIEKFPVEQ